jgi:uncharacterized membrane protein
MRYSESFGSNFWYRIILFYLIMSFLLGFVFGISGSLYAILLDINIESYNKALMIGFTLLIVSILIIIFSCAGFWTVSQKRFKEFSESRSKISQSNKNTEEI